MARRELILLWAAPMCGLVGVAGAVAASRGIEPIATVQGFGTAGEWFAGTAAVAAVALALFHRASDDESFTDRAMARLIGLTYSYESIVVNFSNGSGSYGLMHSELARLQGEIATEAARADLPDAITEMVVKLRPEGDNTKVWEADVAHRLCGVAVALRNAVRMEKGRA